MKKVVAFICDFCPVKKRYATSTTGKNHEKTCFYNPERRACATCGNFTVEPFEPDTGAGGRYCAEDFFRKEEGEGELRFNCEKWKPRDPDPARSTP